MLSSHNMLEVEYLCQRVVLINDGMVAVQGTPRELKEAFSTDDMEEVFLRASGGRSDS
ncbi:hypothetical protein HS1genome_1435 [Sulfodiicoccus acidiphilus]|uniref:Uncharacterized protein n=1 Tax=Sulfodiicoccus acidiphilus TaxID=1670455 RepID=A0A348B4E4_9CREN|nr:hypothetical protein [Sulfodiicoccus acidiphilus]BBD73046.1 hypothetical protein HS1genome_1435 [Sulfodiicoccus acidiphilus]